MLVPLGPGGARTYATKIHDLGTDRVETDLVSRAPADAVVVFDCTFLQRGSLRDHWDVVVYLDVDRDVAVDRGARRDAAALGGLEQDAAAYDRRYMAACDIYRREERPAERADIVIDQDDLARPRVLRGLA